MVTATKTSDNKYNYSTIAVVLLTELIKLIISIAIYSRDNHIDKLLSEIFKNVKILLLYFVPAFLYCLYNNLAFVNLASYDPTTYYLLLQLRVVVTGLIYEFLFRKKLTKSQWSCLILLTIGCIVKQLGSFDWNLNSIVNLNLFLILLQVFFSCFAGVYNEYLLKDKGSQVHIMIQNVFMYIDSILCNLIILLITGQIKKVSEMNQLNIIFSDPKIVAVMINNAFCGIVTSIFLKRLDSILKTFASALELVFTAVFCWIIFNIAIDVFTVIAITIVSYSTYKYSGNPVINNCHLDSRKTCDKNNYVLLNQESHYLDNVDGGTDFKKSNVILQV